jgi:arylsulfatase A-like enzyme
LAFGEADLQLALLAEKRRFASIPPAGPGLPNVILLVWDTVRWADVSLYGYPRPTTPELTEMGWNGVAFEWALSAADWSVSSHAVMLTGLLEHWQGASPTSRTTPTTLSSCCGGRRRSAITPGC